MKKNSLELKDSIHQMVEECRSMVELCKKEVREMTEDEEKHFDELKDNIEEKKRELSELEEELKSYEEKVPKEEIKKENKNNNSRSMKKLLQQEIRELSNGENLKLNAETRTISVGDQGEDPSKVPGVHDDVIETEIQGILEPLYAK